MWISGLYSTTASYFICRALSFSGFVQDHWSDSSLISNPWITCHVPRFAMRLGPKHHATFCPGIIPSRRYYRPHLSAIRLRSKYSILLSLLALSFVQLFSPESSTAVDVINLYLWAIRLGNTYQIPLGSVILTTAQVHFPESSTAIDPLYFNSQLLDHSPHNQFHRVLWIYLPCKFCLRNYPRSLMWYAFISSPLDRVVCTRFC